MFTREFSLQIYFNVALVLTVTLTVSVVFVTDIDR